MQICELKMWELRGGFKILSRYILSRPAPFSQLAYHITHTGNIWPSEWSARLTIQVNLAPLSLTLKAAC